MGKNRKSKKEAKQGCQHAVSDDESYIREISTDFMTSDNFCVVQKKKHARKTSDGKDEIRLPRSRCNSEKTFDMQCDISDDNKNNHTSFWTKKLHEISSEVVEQCSDACYSSEDPTESSELSSPSDAELQSSDLKRNADSYISNSCLTEADEKLGILNDILGPIVSDASLDLHAKKDTLTHIPSQVRFKLLANELEDDVCCEKVVEKEEEKDSSQPEIEKDRTLQGKLEDDITVAKKNKRKERKKSEIDEEIEKILKELDGDNRETSQQRLHVEKHTENIISTVLSKTATSKKLKKHDSFKSVDSSSINVVVECNSSVDFKDSCPGEIDMKSFVKVESHAECTVFSSCDHASKTVNRKKKSKRAKEKPKSSENVEAESCKENMCENHPKAHENPVEKKIDGKLPSIETEEETKRSCKMDDTEKRDRKRPSKKQLALIQEALKKAKEEEERLRKEEEAKQKAAEEAERIRLEKLRLEQEKKEKKKLKEKQKREKMKAEGRLLSKSQKHARARLEATLAAFRQQGINIPQINEKRPHGPRLGNDKTHRKRQDSTQSNHSTDASVAPAERVKSESLSSQESGKYSLSDLPSSFESKASWEVSSIEGSSALTAESGHLSCSEESDILDEPSENCVAGKETNCVKLQNSSEKTNGVEINLHLKPPTQVAEAESKPCLEKLRSPVVCVLGHVDTGKTKILDYIRKTHVQDSEAGGITQQIGATMIPQDALKEKCKMVKNFPSLQLKVPGLLVIDTPGHESFSNLRSRGSSICDIAILVVDIMHGLEPQTIESINLLKKRKTPFVVALNKIDRIYGWKSSKNEDIKNIIDSQSQASQTEFKKRCQEVILQFANECLNAALYYENSDPRSFVSMVPTSAITGDGMGNILGLLVELTQSLMHKKLIFSNELQATVLEVKVIPGLGTTIDVILVNGLLSEGDTIVLAGHDGPFVTQIRSILMPQPLKELRVKNPYKEYKTVEGAQGVKIAGRDLDKAIAGLPLFVAQNHNEVDHCKEELNILLRQYINLVKTSERGVYVQASTLGSLEALLEFLKNSGIPYFGVKIGPVVKKDVMKASVMLEHDNQYACILAFDVKIERDAQELADNLGVRIFHADIIYHLFDMYVKHRDELLQKRQDEIKRFSIFPCKLKILPEFVCNDRDPIELMVSVEAGVLREGTPLCVPSRDNLDIGFVSAISANNKPMNSAKKGQEVCIKIEPKPGESPKTYGKHFDHDDLLISRISRQSIDICKEHHRDELQASDWQLMVELKKMLHVV